MVVEIGLAGKIGERLLGTALPGIAGYPARSLAQGAAFAKPPSRAAIEGGKQPNRAPVNSMRKPNHERKNPDDKDSGKPDDKLQGHEISHDRPVPRRTLPDGGWEFRAIPRPYYFGATAAECGSD